MSKVVTYPQLMQAINEEKIFNIATISATIENLMLEEDYEESYISSVQKKMRDIVRIVEDNSIQYEGTADHFHNLAVEYARMDMYDSACRILERGIKDMPTSVDLLADFIKYGISCRRHTECKDYYERLQSIPFSQWNWRAYSFSIDYLLDCRTRMINSDSLAGIKREALAIANRFIRNIKTEQAFFDKASIYQAFNETKKEREVLLLALNSLRATPKCALRLADIEFDEGNFESAVTHLRRCCNSFSPQPDISRSYTYLLSALGKASLLFETKKDLYDFTNDKDAVNAIYTDFHTAIENGLSGIYKKTADAVIKTIAAQSNIEYPHTDSTDMYDF